VAELCHVIQIFVSDDAALLEVIEMLTGALTAHHLVVAHSTVAPDTMRSAAQKVERRGARFLEAPFTGSKIAAENGQLVYYIGGDEIALKQARPILEASSKEIIEIGEVGSASVIKVATNIVTAATAEIAAEALAIVRRAGISGEIFSRAMKSNATNSTTLEMKVPMMLAGNFEPHFSVKHMLKDVRIAEKLGREYGLELPMTEVASDVLLSEMKLGRGDADYASVAQRYFPVSSSSAMLQSTETPRIDPGPAMARPISSGSVESSNARHEQSADAGSAHEPQSRRVVDQENAEQVKQQEPVRGQAGSESPVRSGERAAQQDANETQTAPNDEAAAENQIREQQLLTGEDAPPPNLSGGVRGWLDRFRRK
jgi:3-hydroxyisobutyrate dehydrogenase-like beta-hydroxyacid dehydrogenase